MKDIFERKLQVHEQGDRRRTTEEDGCLIKEWYLGNFYKDNCGIKILYEGAGRGYGGGGRICPKAVALPAWALNYPW